MPRAKTLSLLAVVALLIVTSLVQSLVTSGGILSDSSNVPSLKYDEHSNLKNNYFQKERVDNFNYKTGVDWVARMQAKQLNLSAAQQSKFNEKKDLLSQQFPKSILYQAVLNQFAANVLNDDFAYL
jgi:hypothetical protein